MTFSLTSLKKIFYDSKKEIFEDFYTFLRFQSISSELQYKKDLLACVAWLKNYLEKIEFTVEIWPNKNSTGHPIIFATYLKAGPKQPTLLIYNHYDVQPVDPLDLWNSAPFEPTLHEGEIYARGAQDNKGQCFYVLLALKTLIEREGTLPINIKLCIEGEEECGSAGLTSILQEKKQSLQADYLAVVDLGMQSENKPAITLGTRGIVTMDVELTGTHTDLHSGTHGGIALNPIHALIQLLNSVRDENGKITIPNFYDSVVPLSEIDRQQLSLTFDEETYVKEFGADPTGGEHTFSPLERAWIRPTFEINGIHGGYSGEGFKTVIPAKAMAKISCRLVPDQDPKLIGKLVADYLITHAPRGSKVAVHIHAGDGKAVRANIHSKAVKAFAKAYEAIFETPCDYIFSGGSIPVITALKEVCGGEVIMVGLGLAGDCIHAPNEHFGEDRIEKGFLSIILALEFMKNKEDND